MTAPADSWQVILHNLGTLYDGPSEETARSTFRQYVRRVRSKHGRYSGVAIALFHNYAMIEEVTA